jgi:alpha-beta hydrolase superfamily lysophospholipase
MNARLFAVSLVAAATAGVIVAAGCGGHSKGHGPTVYSFTTPDGSVQSRIEETDLADGSQKFHGETIEDFRPGYPLALRLLEDVEIDSSGRLVHADLSIHNTVGATEIVKRVVFDPAAGEVRVTRPSGSTIWKVPNDEPWLYYPFASDPFFSVATSSPLSAWVIARGVSAAPKVRFLVYDDLLQLEINAGTSATILYAANDTINVGPDFIDSIVVAAAGATLIRTTQVVPRANLAVVPEVTPATVAFPDCTVPGTVEQFAVASSGGVMIKGEVDLPAGPGPFAFVVFNAGSGGADRDEYVGGIPRWACLAKPLVEAGIAVARYDDRGHGLSGGDASLATFDDRTADAVAVAGEIAARADLNPARLFLLGHSEGVAHVSAAAAVVPAVDGLLFLSGVGTSGLSTFVEQSQTVLDNYGAPASFVAAFQTQRESDAAQIAAGTYPATTYGGITVDFWKQFFLFDGAALAATAHRPTAIFQGGADWQVDPKNATLLANAITGAGEADVTVHAYAGDGHFESTAPVGFPVCGDEYFVPLSWDATLTSDLVAWVEAH